MRRTVVKALIFFILFANLAWAADGYERGIAHDPAEVQASISTLDGQPDEDGGTDHAGLKHGPCDHCCHGTAHYVGFPPDAVIAFPQFTSTTPTSWLTTCYSRDTEPPLPPPNI